jgi:hypothetical protein
MGFRKIVHIDMDAFYASVEQRDVYGRAKCLYIAHWRLTEEPAVPAVLAVEMGRACAQNIKPTFLAQT